MALNGTMVKIETVTVGSGGAANIEFTNIPQTYTDLVIKVSARSNRASFPGDGVTITLNTTGINAARGLAGDGGTPTSDTDLIVGVCTASTATASTFGNMDIYIPNYTSSTNKSISSDAANENNATNSTLRLTASLVNLTSAVTSLKLAPFLGTLFAQYSTATLYGISKVPSIAKAYGGEISFDSNYVYHVFPSSGTFTPLQNLTVDYLVIAGGGGGGYNAGAGGGAGGFRCTVNNTGGSSPTPPESSLSLTNGTNYTVTVGAGGAGGLGGTATIATAGGNSVFSTITSTGGGLGGSGNAVGGNGGSGGGGGYNGSAGGTGTTGQGRNGGSGTGNTANNTTGGGGGGASGVGANAPSSTVGGAGGAGQSTSISGSSTTYAGGGGGGAWNGTGGAGGSGGGGAGSGNDTNATAGTANTGSGGGAGGYNAGGGNGGNGGSGIVIVRYAK
jgi:hypothetical protein